LICTENGVHRFPEADHHFHLPHLRCRFSTTAEAMNYLLRLSDAPVLWVVEQTFSFGRNRRLANDFENLAETLVTFRYPRSIQLALRRFARA
jgi:hypothetical protein